MNTKLFPENFIWGTATAGHQVEGNNHASNWWAWEQQGLVRDGSTSGVSVDYWNRFEEDHTLMNTLGFQAFRLGIEWARIEPEPGRFDEDVTAHYHRILQSLRKHNIKICLTINHWVLPQWIAEQHDWLNPKTIQDFLSFAEHLLNEFGMYPDWWVTLNEPMVPSIAGNLLHEHPPQRHSWKAYRAVSRALLKAHAELYHLIHRKVPKAPDGTPTMVGVAQAYPHLEPWGSSGPAGLYEKLATSIGQRLAFDAWDRAIQTGNYHPLHGFGRVTGLKDSYDYCGINYYFRMSLRYDKTHKAFWHIDPDGIPPGIGQTQMGWQIYPEGIYHVIKQVWERFRKPILILENGIADDTDVQRPAYILDHLEQIHRAISEGIPVQAYFYWSYIDNFEWREGYAKKFGLIATAPSDPLLKRHPRPSAQLYSDIIRANGITDKISEKYRHQ